MKVKVTLVASGHNGWLKVQDKLKENNIHSKVVSMPCMELLINSPEEYRKDIGRKFINRVFRS